MSALVPLITVITCPSCEETYELEGGYGAADGSMVRCGACGHSWLEARALEVVEASPAPPEDDHFDLDEEASRIAIASRALAAERQAKRRRRRSELRGWAVLAAAVLVPVGLAVAFPETVVRAAPATVLLYEKAGIGLNVRGLEIRNARGELMTLDGTRVLAVKGDIVNVSDRAAEVPSMRFGIRDASSKEVYAWTLASLGNRSLKPGTSTSFMTRIASPPEAGWDVEIRFAREDEIAVNAGP